MAAGTSVVIQREVSLSSLSINQPVINSRPYGNRIQSAQLFISQSQGQQFEFGRTVLKRSPDIGKLDVSAIEGNKSLLHHREQQQTNASAFTNFRLLQRLAVSARARVRSSCEPKEDYQKYASSSKLDFPQEGDGLQNGSLRGISVTESNSNAASVLPADQNYAKLKATEKVASSVKKSRRQKLKKPKPVKPLPGGVNHHAADTAPLHPIPKVVPTFSKRFNRHRKTQSRNRKFTNQADGFSPGEAGNSHPPSKVACDETRNSQPALTTNDLISSLSCVRGRVPNSDRELAHEASLRAIYESSGTATTSQSVPSEPLKKLRLRKIFQSDKQSPSISECGRLLPCAPPTSPTPLVLEKCEIIPSLADLKSQQSIKQRLKALDKDTKKRQSIQEEKRRQNEMEAIHKQMEEKRILTRQQVYALNKIMTKLEKEHYKKFQERMKSS